MSLGKKEIAKSLSSKAFLPNELSKSFLDKFIYLLKSNHIKQIKISNFGTFSKKKSPQRLGRNPKTKKEYVISEREKLTFKASNKIKEIIN